MDFGQSLTYTHSHTNTRTHTLSQSHAHIITHALYCRWGLCTGIFTICALYLFFLVRVDWELEGNKASARNKETTLAYDHDLPKYGAIQ